MTVYKIKRIYESPESDDGYRVLVDRLWPRGISKERAALDEWAKEIAPTNIERRWMNQWKIIWQIHIKVHHSCCQILLGAAIKIIFLRIRTNQNCQSHIRYLR